MNLFSLLQRASYFWPLAEDTEAHKFQTEINIRGGCLAAKRPVQGFQFLGVWYLQFLRTVSR